MFITKTIRGMILVKGKDDTYNPPTGQSSRWKHWMTKQTSYCLDKRWFDLRNL